MSVSKSGTILISLTNTLFPQGVIIRISAGFEVLCRISELSRFTQQENGYHVNHNHHTLYTVMESAFLLVCVATTLFQLQDLLIVSTRVLYREHYLHISLSDTYHAFRRTTSLLLKRRLTSSDMIHVLTCLNPLS